MSDEDETEERIIVALDLAWRIKRELQGMRAGSDENVGVARDLAWRVEQELQRLLEAGEDGEELVEAVNDAIEAVDELTKRLRLVKERMLEQ